MNNTSCIHRDAKGSGFVFKDDINAKPRSCRNGENFYVVTSVVVEGDSNCAPRYRLNPGARKTNLVKTFFRQIGKVMKIGSSSMTGCRCAQCAAHSHRLFQTKVFQSAHLWLHNILYQSKKRFHGLITWIISLLRFFVIFRFLVTSHSIISLLIRVTVQNRALA